MTNLITGCAGFIGFHLSLRLLKKNKRIIGIDNLNSYYDQKLKYDRLKILKSYKNFFFYKENIQSKKIKKDTSIYIADTLGELELFYSIADFIFIGGSFVNHGGQNPIEPARYGLNILHGPNIQNFKDIYQFFNKSKIAHKFTNLKQLISISDKLLMRKKNKKINLIKIGNSILKKNVNEITKTFNNELKKT